MTEDVSRAVVRSVPSSFRDAIKPPLERMPIDVSLAREQHAAYVSALEAAGLKVHRLPADERFPDSCFVEDPAVVLKNATVLCNMASPSRRGEGDALIGVLGESRRVFRMQHPATMDGGDVIKIGPRLYVGRSRRTNDEGIDQLRTICAPMGIEVVEVAVEGALHLKSACTYLGRGRMLVSPGRVDTAVLKDLELIEVPPAESYAANCLSLGTTVLVSSGYPETAARVKKAGFEPVALDMSEFRKAGGSLTCLSILLH